MIAKLRKAGVKDGLRQRQDGNARVPTLAGLVSDLGLAVRRGRGNDRAGGGSGERRFRSGQAGCGRARNSQEKPQKATSQDKPHEEKPQEKPSENAADKSSEKPTEKPADPDTREAVCLMIEAAARANDLPLEFFARVIWQESRFQSDAMGPMTRSGQRAQGIAQFMPGTASERRLLDPFDPVQALPKSAEFLNQLRSQFGNLGLAAAAYNAGPRRVQEWLAGTGSMPQETRHYVSAITGATVEEWQTAGRGGQISDRARRAHDLPGSDGAAQARAELFCQPARAERAARCRPAMGRPTGRRVQSRPCDGDVFPRDVAIAVPWQWWQ